MAPWHYHAKPLAARQPQVGGIDALGARATHRRLTSLDAAGDHCHVGASDLLNQVVMDWLADAFERC